MPDGFPNKPKILRGAFVEFGLSLPPLFVVFQFNPVQLTRNRSLTFAAPAGGQAGTGDSLREFHERYDDLTETARRPTGHRRRGSDRLRDPARRHRRTQ